MVTFRCKRSGNTVSFVNEGDIKGLRAHEGYTEVIDNVEAPETIENQPWSSPIQEVLTVKRKGRPPKVVQE